MPRATQPGMSHALRVLNSPPGWVGLVPTDPWTHVTVRGRVMASLAKYGFSTHTPCVHVSDLTSGNMTVRPPKPTDFWDEGNQNIFRTLSEHSRVLRVFTHWLIQFSRCSCAGNINRAPENLIQVTWVEQGSDQLGSGKPPPVSHCSVITACLPSSVPSLDHANVFKAPALCCGLSLAEG